MKRRAPQSPSIELHGGVPDAKQWQRIDAIFQEVVELTPAEREKRLCELTGDDVFLRSELESLLAFDGEQANSLPAIRRTGSVTVASRRPGSLVGRYRLLFPISINRNSEVWCAEPSKNPEATNASSKERGFFRVAIKFLREEANTARRLERFRKEALLLARFRHPNIAELVDVGSDENAVPFIVTRYVKGSPITEFADHRYLTIDERIRLMIRVCDAVSYAHRFLIVHRDLKPSNILVTEEHEPVILDFGISKSLQGDANARQDEADAVAIELTTTNERPMTPAYATPEQVHGEPITTATDVYALGLILYELLSGHHPYSDEAQPANTRHFDRVCGSLPSRPSDVTVFAARGIQGEKEIPQEPTMIAALRKVTPKQLRKRLRCGLDAVVLRAISKQPSDRYESIADFRNDLHNVLERQPIAAKMKDDQLRNRIRRSPLRYVLAATIASAVLSGVLGWYFTHRSFAHTEMDLRIAKEAINAARQLAETADQDRNSLSHQLNTTETLLRSSVVGPQYPDLDQAANPVLDSPSANAFLARRSAEDGQFLRAFNYLGAFRDRSYDADKDGYLPISACLDFAYAHQHLGNPTKALSFLTSHSFHDPPDHVSKELTELKLRLLLDAERVADAEELVDNASFSMFETNAGRLTLARYRAKIQWNEGAAELIAQLKQMRDQFELTLDEQLELALLQAQQSNRLGDVQRILDCSSQRSAAFDVRGRALLQLANAIDSQKTDEKAEAYERVLAHFAALPNHWIAFAAMESLSSLFEDQKRLADASAWRVRLQERLLATNELGTNRAAWCLIAVMRNNEDVEQRERILTLLKRKEVNHSNPYIHRQILTYDFALGIHRHDWDRAMEALTLVCPIEKKLWGGDSLDYALVLASKGFVRRQQSKEPHIESPDEVTAKEIIRAKLRTTKASPARAFLEASLLAANDNQGNSTSKWIELYMMHRLNSDNDQLGMVRFVYEQSTNEDSESMQLLRAVLE